MYRNLIWLLAAPCLVSSAQAVAFRDAPTLQKVLERGGAKIKPLKPGAFSLELGNVQFALVYRSQGYEAFMEPGYRQPDLLKLTAGMTDKQRQEYLDNLKPPAPLGTYVQGVLVMTADRESRTRPVVQKLASRVMAECYGLTAQQLTTAQQWIAASWGRERSRTFGSVEVMVGTQKQDEATLHFVSINFSNFGGRLPNQSGWTKFCREK